MIGTGFTEILLLLILSSGQTGLPLGVPPGPADPMMAQFAPAECIFYTSWSPSTTPSADSTNATERWMAQPEMVASFNKLKEALKNQYDSGDEQERKFSAAAFEFAENCLRNPAGFYISTFKNGDQGPTFEGGAMFHLGDDAEAFYARIATLVLAAMENDEITVEKDTIDGTSITRTTVTTFDDESTIFEFGLVQNQYLAVTMGKDEMKRLLQNIKTDAPQWLEDMRAEIPVDRESNMTWINIEPLVKLLSEDSFSPEETAKVLELTGMNQLRTAGWIAGLNDEAFVTRTSIRIEGEPKGILGVLTGEDLEPETYNKIADDRMVMTGIRLSPVKLFDFVREVASIDDFTKTEFESGLSQLNTMLDLDLEEDVIAQLDDQVYVYGSVNFADPTAGWVLSLGASNELQLTATYEKITNLIKENTELTEIEFNEKEINQVPVYSVKDKSEWGFMPNFTWCMTDGEILISLDSASLRRHLRRDEDADDSLAKNEWFQQIFDRPVMEAEGPLMVASVDISTGIKVGLPLLTIFGGEIFPDGFGFGMDDIPSIETLTANMKPNLSSLYRTPNGFQMMQVQTFPGGSPGSLLAVSGIGMAPAAYTVRRAARRTDGANRMRQLALAMLNFESATTAFPAQYSKNAEDEPLLSWRVHILPYIEENDLYEQFHLDEPWDSEHNKALIAQMPEAFMHPTARPEEGKTVFVVAAGDDTAIPPASEAGAKGIDIADITDGTSNTGLIFEVTAEKAVIWTKPEDLDWSGEDPVGALFDGWDGGVNVAMADGSIRFFSQEKLREIFINLVKRNDGEVIDIWE